MMRPRILTILWSRTRISTHLLLYFLCISLIPCGLLTVLTLYISSRSLEHSVRQTLMAVSDAKATQLEVYIRERRGDLSTIGRTPSLMDATRNLVELRREPADSPALAEASRGARSAIESYADTYGYRNALLFDPDGNTLFRYLPDLDPGPNLTTGSLRDSELAEAFDRVRTLLQVDLSDYQVYPGRSEPMAFIVGPVYDPRGGSRATSRWSWATARSSRPSPTTTGWARPARRSSPVGTGTRCGSSRRRAARRAR
jgi:methyl-accepting chemotaxis protein WspA